LSPTYPQRPLVSATMNLIPFKWQNSLKHFCSLSEESVRTTTWKRTIPPPLRKVFFLLLLLLFIWSVLTLNLSLWHVSRQEFETSQLVNRAIAFQNTNYRPFQTWQDKYSKWATFVFSVVTFAKMLETSCVQQLHFLNDKYLHFYKLFNEGEKVDVILRIPIMSTMQLVLSLCTSNCRSSSSSSGSVMADTCTPWFRADSCWREHVARFWSRWDSFRKNWWENDIKACKNLTVSPSSSAKWVCSLVNFPWWPWAPFECFVNSLFPDQELTIKLKMASCLTACFKFCPCPGLNSYL